MTLKASTNTCASYMTEIKWCLLNSYSKYETHRDLYQGRLFHMFLHILNKYLWSMTCWPEAGDRDTKEDTIDPRLLPHGECSLTDLKPTGRHELCTSVVHCHTT